MTTEQQILEFASVRWGSNLARIGMKLGEEAGEVLGALIKMPEGRATEEDLDNELGDLLIVISQLAARRATTIEALRAKRFAFIQERFAEPAS